MNQLYQTILVIVGSITSLGILAGGIGYCISSFKKGSKEEKNEVITTSQEIINFWRSQAENLQVILERKEKEWNERFQLISSELGELRGQLNAEKIQNERLEKIFQGKNPEQEEFMRFMVKAVEGRDKVYADLMSASAEIIKIVGDIQRLAVEEHNRETRVETTITKS